MQELEKKKKEPSVEELKAKLDTANLKLQEEVNIRAEVLADPDVRALLQAKKDGTNLKLVPPESETPASMKTPITPKESSLDDINNMKLTEFMDVVASSVEDYVSTAITQARDAATKEADARFVNLETNQEKVHKALVKQAAAAGINYMQGKYNDFEHYRPQMAEVMKATGVGPEEAYFIVKGREGSKVPSADETLSERPSPTPPIVPVNRDRSRDEHVITKSRNRSFRDLLNTGAETALKKRSRI